MYFFTVSILTQTSLGKVSLLGREVVYYESMKRDLKTRPLYECRCDERLKTKAEESTCLGYTVLLGELEYLGKVVFTGEVCLFATGLKKTKTEGKKCHTKSMKNKKSW